MSQKRGVKHLEAIGESMWMFTLARIMQVIGIPALLAIGGSVYMAQETLRSTMASVETSIALLKLQVEAGSDDRYRGAQARADLALRDQRIDDLVRRVALIERIEDDKSRALRGASQ